MNNWRNESWRKSPLLEPWCFSTVPYLVWSRTSLWWLLSKYTQLIFLNSNIWQVKVQLFLSQPSVLLGLLDNHKLKYLDLLQQWWGSSSYISEGANSSSLNLEVPSQWLKWVLISFFMALSHALSKKFSLQNLSFSPLPCSLLSPLC